MNDFNKALADLNRSFQYVSNVVPKTRPIEIDPESTFPNQIMQQTNQIIEKSNEQITLLNEQNEKLVCSLNKLEDLYELKEKELEEARKDAKKAKSYNTVMMIITVISMFVAIAAWLVPNILGGVS